MQNETVIILRDIELAYRQKHDLLTGYLKMARTQADMLAAGATEKVAAVLAAKDKRIAEIDKLDARLADAFARLGPAAGEGARGNALARPEAAAAAAARAEVNELLAEIRTVEAANEIALRQQMEDLTQEIGQMQERKAAAGSYKRRTSTGDGVFFDKRK